MSLSTPSPSPVLLPQAPAAPPMFGAQPGPGQKPAAKASQPTFIGSAIFPGTNSGSPKTLIGQ